MTKQTVYLPADGKSCDFIVRWYDDSYENDVKREEGYFFTPEQLNEYTANVIKQALETAAENAKVVKDLGEDLNGIPVYEITEYYYDENGYPIYTEKQSITNTFKETYKKFEV